MATSLARRKMKVQISLTSLLLVDFLEPSLILPPIKALTFLEMFQEIKKLKALLNLSQLNLALEIFLVLRNLMRVKNRSQHLKGSD